jgi:hypothetical protein
MPCLLPSLADLDAAQQSLDSKLYRTNPPRSVLTILGESHRLAALLLPLRDRFATLPDFDMAVIDKLPELIARAQTAEVTWEGARIERRQLSLHKTRNQASSLRYALVAIARHECPEDSRLAGVRNIEKRRRIENLVCDLRRLTEIVEDHREAFAGHATLPEEPAKVARQLADTLVTGDYNPERYKAHYERNTAFALLAMVVEEARSAGLYLFRHDPFMLDRLSDQARRKQRRKRSRAEQAEKTDES